MLSTSSTPAAAVLICWVLAGPSAVVVDDVAAAAPADHHALRGYHNLGDPVNLRFEQLHSRCTIVGVDVADDEADRHMGSMGPLVAVAAALADDRPSDSFVGFAVVDTLQPERQLVLNVTFL